MSEKVYFILTIIAVSLAIIYVTFDLGNFWSGVITSLIGVYAIIVLLDFIKFLKNRSENE